MQTKGISSADPNQAYDPTLNELSSAPAPAQTPPPASDSGQQGWLAEYNRRLQTMQSTSDPALKEKMQAELDVIKLTLNAMGIQPPAQSQGQKASSSPPSMPAPGAPSSGAPSSEASAPGVPSSEASAPGPPSSGQESTPLPGTSLPAAPSISSMSSNEMGGLGSLGNNPFLNSPTGRAMEAIALNI